MTFPLKGFSYETLRHWNVQGVTNGRKNACSDFELNHAECMEAYGMIKGSEVCEKFYEDFKECVWGRIAHMRYLLMRAERNKKILTGEIPWNKRQGQPYAYDSFIMGTFFP